LANTLRVPAKGWLIGIAVIWGRSAGTSMVQFAVFHAQPIYTLLCTHVKPTKHDLFSKGTPLERERAFKNSQ